MRSSKNPFDFTQSRELAPINCKHCGANAYCVRRMPMGKDIELQTHLCSECRGETQIQRGVSRSDAEVQQDAERLTGIGSAK